LKPKLGLQRELAFDIQLVEIGSACGNIGHDGHPRERLVRTPINGLN
jgi:hypothetical protein